MAKKQSQQANKEGAFLSPALDFLVLFGLTLVVALSLMVVF